MKVYVYCKKCKHATIVDAVTDYGDWVCPKCGSKYPLSMFKKQFTLSDF